MPAKFSGGHKNNVPTTGYWPLLEMDWLPADGFVDLDIHAVGYDWRRNNGVEANDIANVIRRALSR